jgi:hypothetical protein
MRAFLTHLYVSYVISSLLVKKIEKEKGFPAVQQLVDSEIRSVPLSS